MRKIIQICTTGVENVISTQCNQVIVALCNDGTVWEIRDNTETPFWALLPEIPQFDINARIEKYKEDIQTSYVKDENDLDLKSLQNVITTRI